MIADRDAEKGPALAGELGHAAAAAACDGQIGQAAYSTSKAGVVGMTLTVARDLASSGIRWCTICPRIFDTPMMNAAPERVRESLIATLRFPKRFGGPDEFAVLAEQIIRTPYLNGETIRLDGAIRTPPN